MGRHYRECHRMEKEEIDKIEFRKETVFNSRRYLSPAELRSPSARAAGRKRSASWDVNASRKRCRAEKDQRKVNNSQSKVSQKENRKESARSSKEKEERKERSDRDKDNLKEKRQVCV